MSDVADGGRNPPDIAARHTKAVRAFIASGEVEKSFPPTLDSLDRKIIHDICYELDLKCKSRGPKKNGRFISIYRPTEHELAAMRAQKVRSPKRLKTEDGSVAMMTAAKHFYPIGTAGKAWGDAERAQWFQRAGTVKRSYADEVLAKLGQLKSTFEVERYGALARDPDRYPLFVVKSRGWDPASKPSLLVTGGTHGYETSGVQGALLFAQTAMAQYASSWNIAVVPCVSPWSYECVQRWNPDAIDPNRSYVASSPAEECALVMELVKSLAVSQWTCHLDLHETTDTDLEEFMPAKASRDGLPWAAEEEVIPDGFYLMGCTETPQPQWHRAMIDAVREVTHIAPSGRCHHRPPPSSQQRPTAKQALGECSGLS
jgi:hypothetical protein